MKASDASKDESLLRRLAENTDETATVALLVALCRQSPELKHWLWEDFGRDAKVRAKFAKLVATPDAKFAGGFRDLTPDARARREEARRLREQIPARRYGGLTWNGVTTLVRHYQAGTVDLGVFLLAHDWQTAGKSTPALMWAGIELLELTVPTGRRRPLKHLNKALAFLKKYETPAQRRSSFGYADWWKLHALFYILRHPCDSYRTRDLRGHLAEIGLEISAKDIRRFCTRHGIRRDMRAGRPRTRARPSKAGI